MIFEEICIPFEVMEVFASNMDLCTESSIMIYCLKLFISLVPVYWVMSNLTVISQVSSEDFAAL